MTDPPATFSWREAALIYTRPRVIGMAFLGFSAGLPFLLVFSTLTAWLAESGISKSTIGFFAWVGITYSIKVLWAPVIDRTKLPFLGNWLGHRRSWMLVAQLGIAAGLLTMAVSGPTQLLALSLSAVFVAFSSATQDVSIDAYRIEAAVPEHQGAMSASYIFGYRVALLAAGAGALYAAEYFGWQLAYLLMAALVGVGVVTVLVVGEPDVDRHFVSGGSGSYPVRLTRWFADAVVAPFTEFFLRNGRFALVILGFIAVFRLSDIAMGIMANPFYLELGYSKTDIANVAKVFGFFMSIAGSALCGVLVVKWGIFRPLLLGAVMVAGTNLLFAVLAHLEPLTMYLAVVISADNISGGIAATAFIAYLSSLTNRSYTATQYALFSSLMTLPGKFISGFGGTVVDGFGFDVFFVVAAVLGLPAILLVQVLMNHEIQGSQR